jgi:hypothetical protein
MKGADFFQHLSLLSLAFRPRAYTIKAVSRENKPETGTFSALS